jgi:hypothetical protein
MFVQTWNKYLPVIRILLKRSLNGDQSLAMNQSDFQRAAGGKKVKYIFSISLLNTRIRGAESTTPLAADLVTALQQDSVTNKFLRENEADFSMNNSFQLSIKNVTPVGGRAVRETVAEGGESADSDSTAG